jgi:YebC/PmpR family DNA-binding regulatory protein
MGGGDPDGNPRLRTAVQEAKSSNVPNDNIDRAIRRGTGELEGVSYEEVTYEGYGPGGVAILVEVVTDNRNRSVAEIRHIFSKSGGNLGDNGCVAWMFDKKGLFAIDKDEMSEEAFMELALEIGAEDISIEEETYEIYSQPDLFAAIREEIENREVSLVAQELAMLPQNQIKVGGDKAPQLLKLMEALEDQEDVQHVWANFDIDADVLASQAG